MKAADVVQQLRVLIPQLTGEFTTNVSVQSLTRSGVEVTAVCNDQHDLEAGDAAAIVGARTRISISSLTRSGTVGKLVTAADHDLTEPIAETIEIEGAVESEFNGVFDRTDVLNRREITFVMADSGPTSATGSPVLLDAESALCQYDGTYEVKRVPNEFTFVVENSATTMLDPVGTIEARLRPRISSAVNTDRMAGAYTSGELAGIWLFVILGDVAASKNREVQSDASDYLPPGTEFRQQVIQDFTAYTFDPCASEIAAADARDRAEERFAPLCRALLGSKFDSYLSVGEQGTVHFLRHGPLLYTTAVYVHEYQFQQVVDITFEDTVGYDLDVAFRDIDFSMDPDLGGTTVLDGFVDLDEEPLP